METTINRILGTDPSAQTYHGTHEKALKMFVRMIFQMESWVRFCRTERSPVIKICRTETFCSGDLFGCPVIVSCGHATRFPPKSLFSPRCRGTIPNCFDPHPIHVADPPPHQNDTRTQKIVLSLCSFLLPEKRVA